MYSTKRAGAMAVLGIGFLLITFIPAALESRALPDLIVGLAIAGGVLISIGRLWLDSIRYSEGELDERQMAIQYRSGWVLSWVLISTIWAIWSIEFFTDMRLPEGWSGLLGTGAVLLQSASHVLLKRRM